MINKNNIPIKKIVPKYPNNFNYDIIFYPVLGSLSPELIKKAKDRTDIIILDIGQSYNNVNDTLMVLNEFKNYPMKNFIWIDHHKWNKEILEKYNDILIVGKTDSCSQLINPTLIDGFCRSIIFYGADCDGILSAVLMAIGSKLSKHEFEKIVDIATKCDTASFIGNKIAHIFHKAVYIARTKDNIKNSINTILEEFIKCTINGMKFTKKILVNTFEFSIEYDEKISKTNEEIIKYPIYNNPKIIALNTSYAEWADLSYICNYFYDLGFKYVLFYNASGIIVTTNYKNIDLTKIFNQCGSNYKIFIPHKENSLINIQDIIYMIN